MERDKQESNTINQESLEVVYWTGNVVWNFVPTLNANSTPGGANKTKTTPTRIQTSKFNGPCANLNNQQFTSFNIHGRKTKFTFPQTKRKTHYRAAGPSAGHICVSHPLKLIPFELQIYGGSKRSLEVFSIGFQALISSWWKRGSADSLGSSNICKAASRQTPNLNLIRDGDVTNAKN